MQILSAFDAISPAFSRTKLVLFSPFRMGRTWKLAVTAYLAMASTAFLPLMFVYLAFLPQARAVGLATLLVVVVVVFTLIFAVLFYLFTRLRFAYFDIVLNRGAFVAPAWRKYGSQSWKWTLLKVLLGSVVTAALAAPTIAYARQIFPVFAALPSLNTTPGAPPSPELMRAIFTIYGAFAVVYLVFGLFFFVSSLLGDFIVPSLALEDTTLAEAFRRLGRLIRNEPGQFTLYSVLKLGLGIAAYMGGIFAAEIAVFLVALILAAIGGLIGYLLHLIGVPNGILIALAIFFGLAFYLFFAFYVVVIVIGTVLTFLESYTLYFLGGRYPMLGALLEASTPPPAVNAPVYSSYAPPPL